MTRRFIANLIWTIGATLSALAAVLYATVEYKTGGMVGEAFRDPNLWPMLKDMAVAVGASGTGVGLARDRVADWHPNTPPPSVVQREGHSEAAGVAYSPVAQTTPITTRQSTLEKAIHERDRAVSTNMQDIQSKLLDVGAVHNDNIRNFRTGKMDEATVTAIREFQGMASLPLTGILDPVTINTLFGWKTND